MFTAIVLAYMLNGNATLTTINLKPQQVNAFFVPKKPVYKGKVQMKCLIFMEKDYKGEYEFYSPESCDQLKLKLSQARVSR